MAKSSKGKKNIKAEKKAAMDGGQAKAEKKPLPLEEKAVQVEQAKSQAVPVADQPANVSPTKSGSFVDKVAQFAKSSISIYTVIILILMGFMFYLRTVPEYSLVFTNWPGNYVNVAEDDGVYHMRLLFNTLQHFPFRALYDPFTHFPYGSMIHFGPLFELIPATFLMIVGLGHPSDQLVTTVAAYFPALLGMLVIIPTYYIGKKLFGKPAGLLGALALAFMPGNFFWRSVLGETDHHVAEVLFMVCTIAALVYALDAARKSNLSFEQIKNKDRESLKLPLIYGALAGIFFGCYMLTWVGALILLFAIGAFFVIQAVIDHLKGRKLDHLVILSGLTFLIPAIMVLPWSLSNFSFQQVYYSITQPIVFGIAFLGICVIYFVSRTLTNNKSEKWTFPLTLVGAGVIGLLVMYLVLPALFNLVVSSFNVFMPSGGLLTVQEAYPTLIDRSTGQLTFSPLWSMFYWTSWISILGLILLLFRTFWSDRSSELLFLVWNIVMVAALIGQNRFTYYFAVNAALLTAYVFMEVMNIIGIDGLKENISKKVKNMADFQRFFNKNMGSCIVAVIVVLAFVFVAIYPALPISDSSGSNSEGVLFQTARAGPPTLPYTWYDALSWMKTHTPDPQGTTVQANFNYVSGQYSKPANYGTASYDYPSSAYGVMSWWDYGHDIEYVANRIPNANPFQAGIIEQNGTTGAAPFFTSTDENTSVKMLDALGSRYVIIDNEMATGKFSAIQQWVNDTQGWEALNQSNYVYIDQTQGSLMGVNSQVPVLQDTAKWNNSIMNRLYYDDADGMSHYRLIYESAGPYYMNMRLIDKQQGYIGFTNPISNDNLTQLDRVYHLYSSYVVATDQQGTRYAYEARQPVKYVKIYEKVKGATLTGSAPDGTPVTASVLLKNDDGREFTYTVNTVAHNGAYSITVPYPTEAMKGDGYSYGVTPETQYTIKLGNTTKTASVPETAVMNGGNIQVS